MHIDYFAFCPWVYCWVICDLVLCTIFRSGVTVDGSVPHSIGQGLGQTNPKPNPNPYKPVDMVNPMDLVM